MTLKNSPLLRTLPAAAFVPALLLPFASLGVFAFGPWERAEPIVIAAHGSAALGAAVLALHLLCGGSVTLTHLRPAWPAAALALWSFIVAWTRGVPMTGLFGVPQSGLGVLWYLDLAIWLALAGLAVETASHWRRLTDLGAAIGWIVAVSTLWGRLNDAPPLIHVTAYYAWPALALPAMLLAHPGGGYWRARVCIVLGAALALLIAADSMTFALAAVLAACIGGLAWFAGDRLAWLRSRRFGLLALAIAALLPFGLVVSGLATSLGLSMRARVLVAQVVLARLQEQWDIWLFGLGWGRTTEAFTLHLDIAQASLWDLSGWDFLSRDYFHSHNVLIETALAAGLPGAALMAAIFALPIWRAPPGKRPYVVAFAVAWLLSLGVWFELIFALPAFALAIAALGYKDVASYAEPAKRLRLILGGLSLVAACGLCIAAGALAYQAVKADRLTAWLDAPQGLPPQIVDIRGDDRVLSMIVSGALYDMKKRGEAASLAPDLEIRRLSWMIAALESAIPQTRNPTLPVVGNNLLTELAINPQFAPVHDALARHLDLWASWVDRGLTLAPDRRDLPVAYLSWRFTKGDHGEVLTWARRLRLRNPDDPVGLYFEGGVYALRADTQQRQQGIALLRRALEHGVERYIPLDAAFKAAIGMPAG